MLGHTNTGVSVAPLGSYGNIPMQGPVLKRMKDNIALPPWPAEVTTQFLAQVTHGYDGLSNVNWYIAHAG